MKSAEIGSEGFDLGKRSEKAHFRGAKTRRVSRRRFLQSFQRE